MYVSAVLVDEIRLHSNGFSAPVATVEATLYEFENRHWVSAHPSRGGQSVGPLVLVDQTTPTAALGRPLLTARRFAARSLRTDGGKEPVHHYREVWTTPENCVYVLLLPPMVVSTQLSIAQEGRPFQSRAETAVTPDARIFHYVLLMGEPCTLEIEARIVLDPEAASAVAERSETVAATSRYAGYVAQAKSGLLSSDFWFRLLGFGSKILGGS